MKFRIHHELDFIDIKGDSIGEIRELAYSEIMKRGWDKNNCWSERVLP